MLKFPSALNEEPIFVDPVKVCGIQAEGNGVMIHCVGGSRFHVKGTAESVAEMVGVAAGSGAPPVPDAPDAPPA